MASLTTTEVLGFCTSVAQALEDNKALLLTKKVDVTDWIPELDAEKKAAVAADSEQEKRKTALKKQTQLTEAALNTAYNSASSKLDTIIGTVGKTTAQGRQLAKLRSAIRRGPNKPPAPPAPTP